LSELNTDYPPLLVIPAKAGIHRSRGSRPSSGRQFTYIIAVVLLALGGIARAEAPEHGKPAAEGAALPAKVETRHSLTLGGRKIDYRAIAESLPVTNAKGAVAASVFTVSYLAEAAAGEPRPVSFVFDGGPGAASVFLHLGALGPRILETPETGAAPAPPARLADNPSSWLKFTDLVFIDPVGTGFSEAAGKGDNPGRPFFDVAADLRSLDAVVRLWLTRHRRWASPVYLVGESYGGFRAAAMTRSLERHEGVVVSGLVLVSPALDLSVLHMSAPDLIAPAVELPSYAASAAALAGKAKAAEDEAEVERFALSDYLVGLAGLKGVPAPGDPFVGRVAHMIGLAPNIVARYRGRVPQRVFAREILRDKGEEASLYDGTVARPAPGESGGAGDPVLGPAVAVYTAAFDIYAPEYLGLHTDKPYRVLPREISRQWNWDAANEGEGGLGLALSSLQAFLLRHPQTKVLIANGRYDLVTPYLGSRWFVDQLAIPAASRAHIRIEVYDGGHMMYMRPSVRAAFARDAARLYKGAGAAL
jgi:carboxypeptidase C (cathepsin A)